ncbi:hypothetical protein RUND412_001379 [Rhizina undulata]
MMFSQINPRALIALFGLVNIVSGFPFAFEKREWTVFDCLDESSVSTILSTNANYSLAIAPFNLRLPWQPAVFTAPETADEVATALKCAKQFGYKVAARGGGHSYAAFGLGGKDGSFIIDVRKFNTISVNQTTGKAKIGAGNRLGNTALGIYEQGERALPHGVCPGVGIAGHALHGGYGFTARMWGIALDKILEIDVVLTNGTITTASYDVNPDLFWALRGAGESYGVVTGFTMQTVAAPSSGVKFTYSFNSTVLSVEQRVDIFNSFQEYGNTTAPAELSLRVYMLADVFEITGAYWGARADFDTLIAPLVEKWPSNYNATFYEAGWINMLNSFAEGEALHQPLDYDQHATFFAKSVVTAVPFTNNTLTKFFTYLDNGRNSSVSWFVDVDLYGGIHSMIRTAAESSSYSIRDAFLTLQLYAHTEDELPPYPSSGLEFLNEMVNTIITAQPETKFKAYTNYVDPTLSASEAHELYYGDNYERLLSIKKSVDPDLVMWNPQAIGA